MSWKTLILWGFVSLPLVAGLPVRADELETKTGERLTGRILSETVDAVEFESTAFGKLWVDRQAIARLERSAAPPAQAESTAEPRPASEPSPPAAGKTPTPPPAAQKSPDFQDKLEGFFSHLNVLESWKTNMSFGLAYRRGQDSDNNFDIRFRSEKKTGDIRRYLLEFRYYRKDDVSAEGVKTVDDDNTLAEFSFRQKLSSKWFFQSNARYYRDPMVDLFNEVTFTAGAGYMILDTPRMKMSVIPAAGPQYSEYSTEAGWHFVAGAYHDFQWDLTKFFKFQETLYFFQDPFNRANHALRIHLEQSQKVTRYFSLGIAYDYTFDGEVGKNIEQNQQRLGVTFGMEF